MEGEECYKVGEGELGSFMSHMCSLCYMMSKLILYLNPGDSFMLFFFMIKQTSMGSSLNIYDMSKKQINKITSTTHRFLYQHKEHPCKTISVCFRNTMYILIALRRQTLCI